MVHFFPEPITESDMRMNLIKHQFKSRDGYYHIRSDDSIVQLRKKRESAARFMLSASGLIGNFIGQFPFVRAVFLSGSLSKGVNNGNADVDLFLISEEKRLWICRAIITFFKKTFLLNKKRFLCANYFLSENHLEIPEKNIFTATELVTLRPLYLSDSSLLLKLYNSNSWVAGFYPNWEQLIKANISARSAAVSKPNNPSGNGYLSKLDLRLMIYYRNVWRKRYPQFDNEQLDLLFRTTPYASKVHPNDFQTKILYEYESRLRKENLQRLTRLND
ncbi:MAG: hypothetical protein ACP5US_07165 [Candidatus Kryptoniota bacterium]